MLLCSSPTVLDQHGKMCIKIAIAILGICLLFYAYLSYSVRFYRSQLTYERNPASPSQLYTLNTSGCRIPYFNVMDEHIKKYMQIPDSYVCGKPLLRLEEKYLVLNVNELELQKYYNVNSFDLISCWHFVVQRVTDKDMKLLRNQPFQLSYNQTITIAQDIEIMRISCITSANGIIYTDYFFFLPNKQTPKSNDIVKMDDKNTISVMLFGIDGISHLNFLRQMPHTAALIHNKLTHVEFWGYNKVADGRYNNVVPLLSGLTREELRDHCLSMPERINLDSCEFIWKDYKRSGFQTAFAEDSDLGSIFRFENSLDRLRFDKQPTDYYLQTIMYAMEKHMHGNRSHYVPLCRGTRPAIDIFFDFIKKLLPHLQTQHFLSLFWTITHTQNIMNMPQLLDKYMEQLLQTFYKSHILNKTVVLLLSDHGLRDGPFRRTHQGMLEDRLPLLIALLPSWFRVKFPEAAENLVQNSQRLVTPFDVHETLLDLMDLTTLESEKITERVKYVAGQNKPPRGISLFLQVPTKRTCTDAGIQPRYCSCIRPRRLEFTDFRVEHAALYVIQYINNMLTLFPQCQQLSLNSILHAVITTTYGVPVKLAILNITDVFLRIETLPKLTVFECTVRISSVWTKVISTINRIGFAGNHTNCIYDDSVKIFCHCFNEYVAH